MKKLSHQSPICPKIRAFGLLFTISLYLLLSTFSVYELIHLSEILTTACMRWKILFVFIIAVLVPIYLAFIEMSVAVGSAKLTLELTPIVILLILYFTSVGCILSPACVADSSSILLSDVISSLILWLFEKLLHTKCKQNSKIKKS